MNNKFPHGFTIVELLIVIVVIGILAAITVFAYNGIQSRAHTSSVQSDIRNAGNRIEAYYVEQNNYPQSDTGLDALNLRASKSSYDNAANFLYCAVTTGPNARFSIAGYSKAKKAYVYSSTEGFKEFTGTWTGDDDTQCPLHGFPSTSEPGYFARTGYRPTWWGLPGWQTWVRG